MIIPSNVVSIRLSRFWMVFAILATLSLNTGPVIATGPSSGTKTKTSNKTSTKLSTSQPTVNSTEIIRYEYTLSKDDYTCSDKGLLYVESFEECQKAVPYIRSDNQYPDMSRNISVKYKGSYPKGCNIHIIKGSYYGIYFNKHESGHAHPGNLQVCTLMPKAKEIGNIVWIVTGTVVILFIAVTAVFCYWYIHRKKRIKHGNKICHEERYADAEYSVQPTVNVQMSLLEQLESVNPNSHNKEKVLAISYNSNREIERSEFHVLEVIGNGNFGTVSKGELIQMDENNLKTTVAIKSVSNPSHATLSDFLLEIKIMSYVNPHINLVSMIGACTSELKKNSELWLVLEYCHYGELKTYLMQNKENLLHLPPDDQINSRCLIRWCYDIAKGMEWIECALDFTL